MASSNNGDDDAMGTTEYQQDDKMTTIRSEPLVQPSVPQTVEKLPSAGGPTNLESFGKAPSPSINL
jgi:hypothetical protein